MPQCCRDFSKKNNPTTDYWEFHLQSLGIAGSKLKKAAEDPAEEAELGRQSGDKAWGGEGLAAGSVSETSLLLLHLQVFRGESSEAPVRGGPQLSTLRAAPSEERQAVIWLLNEEY